MQAEITRAQAHWGKGQIHCCAVALSLRSDHQAGCSYGRRGETRQRAPARLGCPVGQAFSLVPKLTFGPVVFHFLPT